MIGLGLACGAAALLPARGVGAEQVASERDIVNLRLGQRILVDDGTCPTGQIKQVTGAQLSSAGVVRRVECVSRQGARR
ncbi:MAG: hypothetical protein M9932_01125 [Xanthobacteraceae bacterium]|nr:hypothetical protein [Xanthobacteraceae bacterium]